MIRFAYTFLILLLLTLDLAYAKEETLRFVSIRSGNAHMHVGPGLKYPVNWQYVRKDLPLEVLAEYDHWRKVRDIDGAVGWMHKSLLSGKRTVWIVAKKTSLLRLPEDESKIIANLSASVLARLIDTHDGWCKVEIKCDQNIFRGWINAKHVWGLSKSEIQKTT